MVINPKTQPGKNSPGQEIGDGRMRNKKSLGTSIYTSKKKNVYIYIFKIYGGKIYM